MQSSFKIIFYLVFACIGMTTLAEDNKPSQGQP